MPTPKELLDYDLMIEVESVYLSTKDDAASDDATGPGTGVYSLNRTAEAMNMTRSKVRKILITLGTMESSLPEDARDMLEAGEPLKNIASILGCSIANVSINAPYRTVIHNGAIKTAGSLRTQRYRARIKLRQGKTISRANLPPTTQNEPRLRHAARNENSKRKQGVRET